MRDVCQDSQKDGSASLGLTVGNRLATELTGNPFSICLNLNTSTYLSTMLSTCLLVRGLICVCVSMCVHMCFCLTVSLFFSSNLLGMTKCQNKLHALGSVGAAHAFHSVGAGPEFLHCINTAPQRAGYPKFQVWDWPGTASPKPAEM